MWSLCHLLQLGLGPQHCLLIASGSQEHCQQEEWQVRLHDYELIVPALSKWAELQTNCQLIIMAIMRVVLWRLESSLVAALPQRKGGQFGAEELGLAGIDQSESSIICHVMILTNDIEETVTLSFCKLTNHFAGEGSIINSSVRVILVNCLEDQGKSLVWSTIFL